MLQTELSSKQTLPVHPSSVSPPRERQFLGQAVLSSAEIKPMFLYAEQALSHRATLSAFLLIFQNLEASTWELQIKYFAKVAKMNQTVKHNFL